MKSFKDLRTDPHRPSSMDPAEYVFVGSADDHPGRSWIEIDHKTLARHGVETGSSDWRSTVNVPFYDAEADGRPNYRCHHCGKHGSNIRYFCFFLHKPTKKVIVVGQICAERFNLGTKEQRRFQSRRDEHFRQAENEEVYDFLRRYAEWRTHGGKYFEFLASLWDQFQERNYLTDKQIAAVRDRWMSKSQEWMQTREPTQDADRHKAEVTHIHEEPTDKQWDYIFKLADELDITAPNPQNRAEAAEIINNLKARVIAAREHEKASAPMTHDESPATEKQLSYINALMDNRKISTEARRVAREALDRGISKALASRYIERLKALPRVDDDGT